MSVYIDDAAWKRFREQVFTRHGTLRKLSDEVEDLIASEDIEKIIASGARRIGISLDRNVSSSTIKRNRPKLRGAMAETILRQMRDRNHAGRVSRQ